MNLALPPSNVQNLVFIRQFFVEPHAYIALLICSGLGRDGLDIGQLGTSLGSSSLIVKTEALGWASISGVLKSDFEMLSVNCIIKLYVGAFKLISLCI